MAHTLTPREVQVVNLITCGYSNKEIAKELGIAVNTVKNHITAIFQKFRAEDRTQAAVLALYFGVVSFETVHKMLVDKQ